MNNEKLKRIFDFLSGFYLGSILSNNFDSQDSGVVLFFNDISLQSLTYYKCRHLVKGLILQ